MKENKNMPDKMHVCGSSDGWAKNQLGESRLGELFLRRQTTGRHDRMVLRQQIERLSDIFQMVERHDV